LVYRNLTQIFKCNTIQIKGKLLSGNHLKSKVNQKIEQTRKSDDTSFPAYIIVVGFNEPKAEMVLRNVKS